MSNIPHVMVVAGEPSGERLGAELISALKTELPSLKVTGVGGEAMAKQGVKTLVPLEDIAVMGITEALPKLFKIKQAIDTVEQNARVLKPDILVVIDSLDFTHAVAERVKQALPRTRIVRYVAPKLWAWRPNRAEKLKHIYDDLLTLFPFETAFFEKFSIPCTFVGHPVVNRLQSDNEERFISLTDLIEQDGKISVALLPGSRTSEIKALLPIFLEVARRIKDRLPKVEFILPVIPSSEILVRKTLIRYAGDLKIPVITDDIRRFEILKEAKCALAASGTVSLELMAANTPSLIAYQVSNATAWIAKKLITMKMSLGLKENYATLLNIMLNDEIMPEFIQEKCTPDLLEDALYTLIISAEKQERQKRAFKIGMKMLGAGDIPPAQRAAEAVMKWL